MKERPKVVFLGSDPICLPVLEALHYGVWDRAELALVVSQPDRGSGRGRNRRPNPVAAWARERGVPLEQPEKPSRELADLFRRRGVRLGLVMAYGHLLPKWLREAPELGMVNFHCSVLPKYRGASPVETAIAMGERETGVSLMRVVREMDAGAVGDVEKVAILDTDTSYEVRAKLSEASARLLVRDLAAVLEGGLPFEEQDSSRATYCRKLEKADGVLDFGLSAGDLVNRVRAFRTWPGSAFGRDGDWIKVGRAAADSEGSPGAGPGTVLGADRSLAVAAGEGVVVFEELQRAGGRMLPAAEFLRGYPIAAGERLRGRPARPLVSDRPDFGRAVRTEA